MRKAFDDILARKESLIAVFWHGEILPVTWAHRGGSSGMAPVISRHSDGEVIARIVEGLGYRTVRGSTTRGGVRALLETAQHVENGVTVAFTPDGPRGPRHVFAPGALIVAQRTGRPIVGIGVSASRAWRVRSWDRHLVPKPFATVTLRYSRTGVRARRQRAGRRARAAAVRGAPRLAGGSLVRRAADAVWNSPAGWAVVARAALAPASMAYRGATWLRNTLYSRGTLPAAPAAIPVVSIGNLAVGGTGKTPVAAWMATQLRERGARPAIVMRGYGDDEHRVHTLVNPDVPVVVSADRVAGVRSAAHLGSDVAILDDAFQHRRLARLEDVVLVSADRWHEPIRLLPSGPWREGPAALSRASLVIVTRKAAAANTACLLMERLARLTRTGQGAVAALELEALCNAVTGVVRPLSDIAGASVLAIAGIGDPESFASQLRSAGARVVLRDFPDHHVYDSPDIAQLAGEGTCVRLHVVHPQGCREAGSALASRSPTPLVCFTAL